MKTYRNINVTGPKAGCIGTVVQEDERTITLEYKLPRETTQVKYPKSILHYFVSEIV